MDSLNLTPVDRGAGSAGSWRLLPPYSPASAWPKTSFIAAPSLGAQRFAQVSLVPVTRLILTVLVLVFEVLCL